MPRLPTLTGLALRDVARRATTAAEREAIQAALRAGRGNKSGAARQLRVDVKTLTVKIRRYQIGTREPDPG